MENTNEMMTLEEIEDTEENVETETNDVTKALIGVGLAGVVLGALVHKYAKPIAKKVKSKFKKKNKIDESDIVEADWKEVPVEEEDN